MDVLNHLVSVVEKAAWASYPYIGKHDSVSADRAATHAMRSAFRHVPIDGTVVIGEGERDQAPMLYIGEKVGQAAVQIKNDPIMGSKLQDWPALDIAVDPLEGTGLCAKGKAGALCVLAAGEKNGLLHAPDVYMDKLACGPQGKGQLSLENSLSENIKILSQILSRPPSQLKVAVLDRPRHKNLIEELKACEVQPVLFQDGDVAVSLLTALEGFEESFDLLLGSGGAPEGVLSAAALKSLGGDFQGRLLWKNDQQRKRALDMGLKNLDGVFRMDDLVKGSAVFCAAGVTSGPLVQGVNVQEDQVFIETFTTGGFSDLPYKKIKNQYSLKDLPQD